MPQSSPICVRTEYSGSISSTLVPHHQTLSRGSKSVACTYVASEGGMLTSLCLFGPEHISPRAQSSPWT